MKRLIQIKIEEVSAECEVSQEIIQKFISEEWIKPFDSDSLLFDEEDLTRIALIRELQYELGVNDEGVPIILNLIDQLQYLRSVVKKVSDN